MFFTPKTAALDKRIASLEKMVKQLQHDTKVSYGEPICYSALGCSYRKTGVKDVLLRILGHLHLEIEDVPASLSTLRLKSTEPETKPKQKTRKR